MNATMYIVPSSLYIIIFWFLHWMTAAQVSFLLEILPFYLQ